MESKIFFLGGPGDNCSIFYFTLFLLRNKELIKHSGFVCVYHLLSWVQILSAQSTLLYSLCTIFVTEKRTKINKKETVFDPIFLKRTKLVV